MISLTRALSIFSIKQEKDNKTVQKEILNFTKNKKNKK